MTDATRTISLGDAGTVTLSLDLNILTAPRPLLEKVFELIDALELLEDHAPPAGPEVTPPAPPAPLPAKPAPKATPAGRRACEECGKTFTPKRKDSRFCSPSCTKVASNRRTYARIRAKRAGRPGRELTHTTLTVVAPTPPERPTARETKRCVDCKEPFFPAHAAQQRCTACARAPEAS